MTRLLLDHPWSLKDALYASSDGFGVLMDFKELLRAQNLDPVPFFKREALEVIPQRTAGAAIRRICAHLITMSDQEDLSGVTLIGAPSDLAQSWKQALCHEMGDLEDWRTPQIIVPKSRHHLWPKTPEVEILCDDGQPKRETRVLAPLQDYESHEHAISDRDPWRNLEWRFRAGPDTSKNYACRLPRPPCLDNLSLGKAFEGLEEARKHGWKVGGRYYFIPDAGYDGAEITKMEWRKGMAFPRARVLGLKGPCLKDFGGRIWVWDRTERHWDVQLEREGYRRVSHDGRDLGYRRR